MPTEDTARLPCSGCREHLPLAAFHHAKTRRGFQNYCKDCQRASARRIPVEVRRRRKKAAHLKALYGISLADYERMLAAQGGVCAICSERCSAFDHLAVDHDHKTGEVRGLLCSACNMGVGQMGEDPNRLRRAATYIESPPFRLARRYPPNAGAQGVLGLADQGAP